MPWRPNVTTRGIDCELPMSPLRLDRPHSKISEVRFVRHPMWLGRVPLDVLINEGGRCRWVCGGFGSEFGGGGRRRLVRVPLDDILAETTT